MAKRKVLVKRLVCIEDLGDGDVLFTDKTGTLTLGRIDYMRAVPVGGRSADEVLRSGLLCTENFAVGGPAVGGNALDQALWESPAAATQRAALSGDSRLAVLPFDHDRQLVSVLVKAADGQLTLVTKGAPETVLERCGDVPDSLYASLAAEFDAGNRVVAVATRAAADEHQPTAADEYQLSLVGLLVFRDPPKPDAGGHSGGWRGWASRCGW